MVLCQAAAAARGTEGRGSGRRAGREAVARGLGSGVLWSARRGKTDPSIVAWSQSWPSWRPACTDNPLCALSVCYHARKAVSRGSGGPGWGVSGARGARCVSCVRHREVHYWRPLCTSSSGLYFADAEATHAGPSPPELLSNDSVPPGTNKGPGSAAGCRDSSGGDDDRVNAAARCDLMAAWCPATS